MHNILVVEIFLALSLILQIYFLRLSKDYLELEDDDPRFKKMVTSIYLNLGIYGFLIVMLFIQLLQR